MKLKNMSVAAIVLAAVASACAPTNVGSLRDDPSRTKTFRTTLNYEVVYNNEQRGFLGCLTGDYYHFTFAIEPKIDHNNKTASIVYEEFGGIPAVWGLVDIRAGKDGTVVTADAASQWLMRDIPDATQRWAEGDFTCPERRLLHHYPVSE